MANHLTVGEIASVLGVPAWKIRRVVDSLDADLPRAGQYRLVPVSLLGSVTQELQRQGWLPSAREGASCS